MQRRVRGLVTMVAGAAVLATSLVAGVAPDASAAGCSVTNASSGVRFTSLQSAVNAAAPRQTLKVSGSCKGNVTIGKALTLLGTGTNPTLRGNGGRPLTITGGPVTIDRLRVTGGVATSCFGAPAGVACGGGIAASKRLIVKRSLIDGNTVSGTLLVQGGGIAVSSGGSLKVVGSVIADNTLTSSGGESLALGGGIASFGATTITRSLIDGNVANAASAEGGGLYGDVGPDASIDVTETIVRDNKALGDGSAVGGGIVTLQTLRLTRSTVAGNQAFAADTAVSTASAGGVRASDAAIANSTITGNSATALGIAVGGALAGGLLLSEGSVVASTIASNTATTAGGALLGQGVEMGSTILAANSAPIGPDCQADPAVTSLGRNLIGDATGCGAVFDHGVKGDKVGNDQVGPSIAKIAPRLSALGDNGGPTPTRALKPGSPAIDAAGGKPCSTTTDQRGVKRPKGSRCDIGAFEKG